MSVSSYANPPGFAQSNKIILVDRILLANPHKTSVVADLTKLIESSSTTTGSKSFKDDATRVLMVKGKPEIPKEQKPIWVEDLQQWFESLLHPEHAHAKNADEVAQKDEWIVKELNELGEKADSLTVEPEEVVVVAEEEHSVTVPTPKPKVQKTTIEWLTRDMVKAGRGDRKSTDWVADDMKKAGKDGLHGDWVADDMKEAGQTGGVDRTSSLKQSRSTTLHKTEEDKIAEGMAQTGRGLGLGWIAQDMKEAGQARESRTTASWTEKLGELLDSEHKKQYDDVFKGMEKAGKQGSHSTDWIQEDMTKTGKAESLMDKLNAATKAVTYKFGKAQEKRYDVDKIREDMESAGHAEARDWVAHDLQTTGQNRTLEGRSYHAPKKELRDWLIQNESSSIASDLEAEGKAFGSRQSRKEIISRDKFTDLIAEDMMMVGKTSGDWIEADMERAGLAEPHINRETMKTSHKQRETDAFMKTRKVKVGTVKEEKKTTKVEEKKAVIEKIAKMAKDMELVADKAGTLTAPDVTEPAQADTEETELVVEAAEIPPATDVAEPAKSDAFQADPAHHHDLKHNIIRASKKVVMPWKKWEEL